MPDRDERVYENVCAVEGHAFTDTAYNPLGGREHSFCRKCGMPLAGLREATPRWGVELREAGGAATQWPAGVDTHSAPTH